MDQMTAEEVNEGFQRFSAILAELAEILADWYDSLYEAFYPVWYRLLISFRRLQLYFWLTSAIKSQKASWWIARHIPEFALLKLPLVGLFPPRLAVRAAVLESICI